MIKVLIVDDSPIIRQLLIHILESDVDIEVIGAVQNGAEAIAAIKKNQPDVITMDVQMPIMDGIAATKAIMSTQPTPIIILTSGNNTEEAKASFQALEAGAVAVILKPNNQDQTKKLLQTIKLMSEVKVITHHNKKPKKNIVKNTIASTSLKNIKLIVMGVSTGGPTVLQTILGLLKNNFPPIVIIQHISPGFIEYMANWLSATTNISVKIGAHGLKLEKNNVYLAPDHCDLGINKNLTIELNTIKTLENNIQPSISYLFRSAGKYFANNLIAILLTGMGQDGAKELKELKDKGAITICQDEASSAVYGMPAVAKDLNGPSHILTPCEIANIINKICDKKSNKKSIINWEFIHSIFENETEKSKLFISNYTNTILKQLVVLQLALQKQDEKKVKEIFHSLKGSANVIIGLQAQCLSAEKNIQKLDWQNLNLIYKDIKKDIDNLKKEVQNKL